MSSPREKYHAHESPTVKAMLAGIRLPFNAFLLLIGLGRAAMVAAASGGLAEEALAIMRSMEDIGESGRAWGSSEDSVPTGWASLAEAGVYGSCIYHMYTERLDRLHVKRQENATALQIVTVCMDIEAFESNLLRIQSKIYFCYDVS